MIQLGVIIGYLLLLLVLGFLANRFFRGTAQDYMLASHTIGPFLLLMSLFGTTMTAFALVGSTGRAYTLGVGVYGLLGSASGIVHSLCFFLVGVPLWSFGKRHGYMTQIQFFRQRLENDWIGLLLFPCLIGLVISYLLLGVVAAGDVVNRVTQGAFEAPGWFADAQHGVPAPLASAAICGVVLTYVFFGGMRGTAWANTFQTSVFMLLGIVTFAVIANEIGGTDSFIRNLQNASAAVSEANRSRAKIPPPVYASFLLIPLSVAMFPHVFQHWLTARDAKAFKLPIVMHPVFIMVVWVPCVLLGAWASAPGSGVPPGTPENQVLATLVKQHAGPVLGGLLTAGVLAAIMSSLDSQFLCVGTIFTEDIVVHYGGPSRFSDRQTVFMARCFVATVVLVTFLLSLFPRAVFDLGLWSFSGFTGLFPLVLTSIYWRRLTAAGAIASVITAFACWSVLFYRSGFGENRKYAFPEAPLHLGDILVIPPMLPVVSITAAAALALVAVSWVTKPPTDATLAKFFRG
jgi:SSS family solute:Na+ symporter